jgi:hypothetical protein
MKPTMLNNYCGNKSGQNKRTIVALWEVLVFFAILS